MHANWDNVLVLQTSFLGDTVLTLPLVAEIRRRFQARRLTLMCLPMAGELLQGHPAVDEILVYDKNQADRGIAGLRRKAAFLESKRFTIALTPHKSLRSALLLRLARIPCRAGFRQSAGAFFFNARANRDPKRHDVERNLSVLYPFGVNVDDCHRELELPVDPAIQAVVDEKLTTLGLIAGKLVIGINAGSVWPTKRWWPNGFALLIQLLMQKHECQILLFGGPEDAAMVADVEQRSGVSCINLVDRIGLRELPAAIGRCQVFVTNDSGPMHVAVARRVPTVAVFCATTPDLGFYPYTSDAIVIGKELVCRPCATHGGRRCPLGTEDCIRQVAPSIVAAAVERLLTGERGEGVFCPQFVAA
jgi:heptosyltransferase-2